MSTIFGGIIKKYCVHAMALSEYSQLKNGSGLEVEINGSIQMRVLRKGIKHA